MRNRILAKLGMWIAVAAFPAASSAGGLVVGDALSRISLVCESALEASGDFPEAVDLSCERHPVLLDEMGTTRAHLSTSFGDLLLAAASTECVDCPYAPSTISMSRLSFEFAVVQHATPPHPLSTVPVRITTAGEVGVSTFGLGAGAGTFVSTAPHLVFAAADVFTANLETVQFTGPIVSDEFAITETLDLVSGLVYFGSVYASCNQNSSVPGDWACGSQAEVSFALDQQAFDASQGAGSFALAQFVAIERSPNLVPESSAQQLGLAALAALVLSVQARRSSTRA